MEGSGWITNNSERGYIEPMAHPAGRPPQPPPMDSTLKMLSDVTFYLQMYYNPALASVGMVANIITCIVLPFSVLYKLSATQYLIGMAIADTMFLLNILLLWFNNMGYSIYQYGSLCHFTMFLSHASCFLSLWYTVCLAVDGFIMICCPYKREKLCSLARARIVVLTLAVVATAVYLNISLTFGVIHLGPMYWCMPVSTLADPLSKLKKIDIFINSIIPYASLVYLLLHTSIQAACQLKKGMRTYTITRGHNNAQTITYPLNFLFVYILVFLLLNLPAQSLKIYYTLRDITITSRNIVDQKEQLLQRILDNLQNFKYAVNFWILLMTSDDFRQGLVHIVTYLCKLCKKKKTKENATLPEGHIADETSIALIEANHKNVATV